MRKLLLVLLLSPVCLMTYAQKTAKKPLNHQVYDSWQSVSSERISNDGQWVLYSVTPQEGDANLLITNLKSKTVKNVQRVNSAVFTEDSKYAVFTIKPFYKETRSAKIKKKKADDMPKDSLGILALGKPALIKIGRVKSFKLPEKGSAVVAYLMDKAPADTVNKKNGGAKDLDTDYLADDETTAAAAKTEGTDLVLHKLATATQKTFKYVTDYSLSNSGNFLVFVSSGRLCKYAGCFLV